MNLRDIFQPDRLPDTGRLHIPAAKAVLHPALFAARLLWIKGILHLHYDLIFFGLYKSRDIKRKPRITASVITDVLPVHPHLCVKITSLKV